MLRCLMPRSDVATLGDERWNTRGKNATLETVFSEHYIIRLYPRFTSIDFLGPHFTLHNSCIDRRRKTEGRKAEEEALSV